MWTLMQTGRPVRESRLASSKVESIFEGSVNNSPAPP